MTTEAQQAANRRNAGKSTGPRTEAGKRRVSRNAITHGLDCKALLLPDEDSAALARYRATMIADHQPEGAEEQDMVERMVAAQWRFLRLLGAEKEVYANQRHRLGPNAWIGSCVIGDLQQEKAFAYLDRKDAQLSREYHRCSARLVTLQDMRRKGLRPEVVEEEAATSSLLVGRASPPDSTAAMGSPQADRAGAGGSPEVQNNTAPDSQMEMTGPTPQVTVTPSSDRPDGKISEQSQMTAVPGFEFRVPGERDGAGAPGNPNGGATGEDAVHSRSGVERGLREAA